VPDHGEKRRISPSLGRTDLCRNRRLLGGEGGAARRVRWDKIGRSIRLFARTHGWSRGSLEQRPRPVSRYEVSMRSQGPDTSDRLDRRPKYRVVPDAENPAAVGLALNGLWVTRKTILHAAGLLHIRRKASRAWGPRPRAVRTAVQHKPAAGGPRRGSRSCGVMPQGQFKRPSGHCEGRSRTLRNCGPSSTSGRANSIRARRSAAARNVARRRETLNGQARRAR